MPPFPDVLPLFARVAGWVLARMGVASRLDPILGLHLTSVALLHFLRWVVGRGPPGGVR